MSHLRNHFIRRCISYNVIKTFKFSTDVDKTTSQSTTTEESIKNEVTISGLAKALGKFREIEKFDNSSPPPTKESEASFLHLLRHSEFVQMGDPRGKIVIGKIFQVVNTDLYVDIGAKFYCVVRKPKRESQLFVRNAEVKLRINEMELCARFLGADKDLTLTEASATLLDLVSTPVSAESVNKMNEY